MTRGVMQFRDLGLPSMIAFFLSLLFNLLFQIGFIFYVLYILIDFAMIDNTSKLVCWNCRGISGRDTSSCVRYMMKKINPIIFCLVETREDNGRINNFCSKLGHKWAWAAIVAGGYSGGIIVIWKKQVGKITPL